MRLPEQFSFFCPLKINSGNRALDHLPFELSAVNASAPLILANRDQVGKKGLRHVTDAFKTTGLTLGVYDRLPDRPEPESITALARMYWDGGCDSIIVVGSGSVVDMAKHLNVMISGCDLNRLDNSGRDMADPGPLAPLMLVATTGGNGNEASAYADDGVRRLASPRLMPSAAFIDPVMMDAMDDLSLADGALIALAHAVEAFLDDSCGPMCRAYAHAAVGLILKYLPMALRKTDRQQSLCAVVNGQMAAGCAFSNTPPGACHNLAVQLKQHTDLSFGFLMAILLPHLVAHAGEIEPAPVGELLYPMVGADIYAVTADDLKIPRSMALFWEFFDAVNAELTLKIPLTLVEAGLTQEQLKIVQSAVEGIHEPDVTMQIIQSARDGAVLIAD